MPIYFLLKININVKIQLEHKIKLYFQDALDAMKALGLNPGEQEMIDMTNEVSVNGLIYYPDFCKLVLRKYREENKEVLNQALFKVHKQSWKYY